MSPRPTPPRSPVPVGLLQLGGLAVLAVVMVGARTLIPSRSPVDPDLVPILVGNRPNRDLLSRVQRYVPTNEQSEIHSAEWTETGLLVRVTTPGRRVVVLLDSAGQATVAHAEGEAAVHLAVPCCEPVPPYTVTVVRPMGPGGLLDARALQVASLR